MGPHKLAAPFLLREGKRLPERLRQDIAVPSTEPLSNVLGQVL
jgi:hypothetical protein